MPRWCAAAHVMGTAMFPSLSAKREGGPRTGFTRGVGPPREHRPRPPPGAAVTLKEEEKVLGAGLEPRPHCRLSQTQATLRLEIQLQCPSPGVSPRLPLTSVLAPQPALGTHTRIRGK